MELVIFDGFCGLCNHFVDFLIRYDQKQTLRFTPIQGETAKQFALDPAELGDPMSIIFVDKNARIYRESTAALRAIMTLGGAWTAVSILLLIPRPIRDFVYRGIAKHRYQWFGRRDACRLPAPAERTLILP